MNRRMTARHHAGCVRRCNQCSTATPIPAVKTVPAGDAVRGLCAGFDMSFDTDMPLATIYFPKQIYHEGFCPDEALRQGTLFPELTGLYE